MKQFYLLVSLLLMITVANAQVAYVDADATGGNNGSTWADAYTNLHDALADGSVSEIWVAAGTYTPGSDTTYYINRAVAVYGGFVGTETARDQRDADINITILSGDNAGDDIVGRFDTLRSDNALQIIYIDSAQQELVTLDGLSIRNGQKGNMADGVPTILFRGAGVVALSSVALVNCTFTQNRASGGAAAYITGEYTDGSTVTNCEFEQNLAIDQGILFFLSSFDNTISNNRFVNNTTNRGSMYGLVTGNMLITDNLFENNASTGNTGGLLLFDIFGGTVLRDTFRNNTAAGSGAGLYIRAINFDPNSDPNNVVVEDCLVEGNTANNFGGGAMIIDYGYTMRNCRFEQNVAGTGSGGGLYNQGDTMIYSIVGCDFINNKARFGGGTYVRDSSTQALIEDCTFMGNIAERVGSSGGSGGGMGVITGALATINNVTFDGNNAFFGGAITTSSAGTMSTITASTFENNTTGASGAGISASSESFTNVDDCVFTANVAGQTSGGVYIQGNGTLANIRNSSFIANQAGTSAGAVWSRYGNETTIDSCLFIGNSSGSFGGAVQVSSDTLDIGLAIIARSTFNANIATDQAGAINISDSDTRIENCLFVTNLATEIGNGGAISINSSLPDLDVELVNSTFNDNIGTMASDIANYVNPDVDSAASVLTLLNNVFSSSSGSSYLIEAGTPEVVSLGGNLATDDSYLSILTHPTDIVNSALTPEDLFVSPLDEIYFPAENSPLINAGVNDPLAPAVDLVGAARGDMPDIGAYEYDADIVSNEEVITNAGQFLILPNPVREIATLQLANEWMGDLTLRLYDLNGRALQQLTVNKTSPDQLFELGVQALPTGQYILLISNGEQALVSKLLKQ